MFERMILTNEVIQNYNAVAPDYAKNPILFGLRGSHAHGTHTSETDDTDFFAVYAHPWQYYLTKSGYDHKEESWDRIFDDPWAGTIDIVAYDVRKFLYMLAKGNPNVHAWLWTKGSAAIGKGNTLLAMREHLLSKRIFTQLMGYCESQRSKMYHGREVYRAKSPNKDYDVKYACHCVQLLYQGINLARTNKFVANFEGDELQFIKGIKAGRYTLSQVEDSVNSLMYIFRSAEQRCTLKDEVPDQVIDELFYKIVCPAAVTNVRPEYPRGD